MCKKNRTVPTVLLCESTYALWMQIADCSLSVVPRGKKMCSSQQGVSISEAAYIVSVCYTRTVLYSAVSQCEEIKGHR